MIWMKTEKTAKTAFFLASQKHTLTMTMQTEEEMAVAAAAY